MACRRFHWHWIWLVFIWKYNSMEEANNTTIMDIFKQQLFWQTPQNEMQNKTSFSDDEEKTKQNWNLTPGTLTLLSSSLQSLLEENDMNTAKRSADLKLLFSQGCMMAESLSSSMRLGVSFRGPLSTQGMDLFPTAVQTFIRRGAAWFLPNPPSLRSLQP